MDDIKEQIIKLQTEIKEHIGLLHREDCEGMSRQELKEEIEYKEKQLAELQLKMDETDGLALPRRSERPTVQTEKMLAYQQEEVCKKEKRLLSLYEQWKYQVRKAKEILKTDISKRELAEMADAIEDGMIGVMRAYSEIRDRTTPSTELRRRIDACEAVTKDIMRIINDRLTEIDGNFNAERERHCLRQLSAHDYAYSIYGTASHSNASHHSETSVLTAKRADAAAELAAKEAQYKVMEKEIKQKEEIRMMEEKLHMQKSKLESLQAEREMEAARARLKNYDREIRQETDRQSTQQNMRHIPFSPSINGQNPHKQKYLHNITTRQRWHTPKRNLQVGDIDGHG